MAEQDTELTNITNENRERVSSQDAFLDGPTSIGKYECYKKWNATKFILYSIIIILVTGLLVGILSNIDRMVGSDQDDEDNEAEVNCPECDCSECNTTQINMTQINCTQVSCPQCNDTQVNETNDDHCDADGMYVGPSVDASGFTWSYDESTGSGPSVWSRYHPQCGCKTHQSPRNIDTIYSELSTPSSLCSVRSHLLHWDINRNYTDEYNGTFEVFHNEHTIQMKNINYENDSFVPIAYLNNLWQPVNSTLHSEFRLEQIHFHWGTGPDNGSPHTLNGKHYPLAIHFVHYSADYDSIGAAFGDFLTQLQPQKKDRYILAVVGAFYEIDPMNTSYNYAFDQLLQSEVLNSNNSANQGFVEKINLTALLPPDLSSYYYYPGSMTTPSCFPIVRWHLLSQPLKINANQIEKFRSIASETITWNSRPTQENINPVYYCHDDLVYQK